jgi:predicted KAP-like P-loop ATPase
MISDSDNGIDRSDVTALGGDKPLTRPEDDRLGYAPFAETLSSALVKMAPAGGFVVALYGPWGSGKTTVLNFVRFYLEAAGGDARVLTFNPWWFSGQEELTTTFLEQLLAALEPQGKRRMKKLRSSMSTLAEYVGEGPSVVGAGGRIAARALRKDAANVQTLKDNVGTLLTQEASRIIVLIDDTDRLNREEIRHLFRLIKAVADFPNVTYVVSMDQAVAREALAEDFGGKTVDYLDKIVQVGYELPLPDQSALRSMFFEGLDQLLAFGGDDVFDQAYWTEVFLDAVDPFLSTPRDVSRLLNVIRATYPAVRGEVNLSDYVATTAVQTFEPTIWDQVRRNQELLAGTGSYAFANAQTNREREKTFYESLLAQCRTPASRGRVDAAMRRLFPRYAATSGGTSYTSEWELTWRKDRRVASPQIFPLYFQQAPPPGHLSRVEIGTMLRIVCDEIDFASNLIALAQDRRPDGSTPLPTYLEHLRDYADDIPAECIPGVVRALYDVGDALLIREDTGGGMFGDSNEIRIMQVLYRVLRRMPKTERSGLIREAIESGRALALAAHEVAVYAQEQGELGAQGRVEDDQTVSADDLDGLKSLIVEKIRSAASADELIDSPDLGHLLYRWADWGSEDEPRTWANRVSQSDEGLIRLLSAFLGEVRSHTSGQRTETRRFRMDPKSIEPFLDPDALIDRVRSLGSSRDFAGRDEAAIEQFIRGYEIRARGEDPNW